MPAIVSRKNRRAKSRRSIKPAEKPLFRIWSFPRDTADLLLLGLEKTVHFLTRGKFLPPSSRNGRHSKKNEEENAMFLAIRPSALKILHDMNNNAVPNNGSDNKTMTGLEIEDHIPQWLCKQLIPMAKYDQRLFEDPACFTLDMKATCEKLPAFMQIVPDKARQNIIDWLTNDPSLMISIPMIPRLIPGNRLGLLFQYGQPIRLPSFDEVKEIYLGYLLDPQCTDMHAVAITFYKLGHGLRDVDLLREAGMMQHVNHKHVMPKFHGMAVVEASDEFCQWVTVMDYVDRHTSIPVDFAAFMNSEIIRRTYFLVSCQRWFDWINLARVLLQNLEAIHAEGIIFGDLNVDSVVVNTKEGKYMPSIVDFKNACYGDYTTKALIGTLPREPLAACAHGYDDAVLSKNMDPSLAYDAYVTQQHDLYSYGYIIRTIGSSMCVPELENLGVRIMHSRQQDRSDGGPLCAESVISELRALTFRACVSRSMCGPVDCYELARQLQKRTPGTGTLFGIYNDIYDVTT